MKVSIITVVYNGVKNIENTIKSVLSQDYENIEYIIIDGKSSDGTQDVIKKYEHKIAYWISEVDDGIYDAMNKGIAVATGHIIAFLNSGDQYLPSTIKRVVEEFNAKDADIIYGDCILYKSENEQYYVKKDEPIRKLKYHMMLNHQSVFAKSELFSLYGSYDTNYIIAADYEWLLKVYNQGAVFRYLAQAMCYYLDGGISEKQAYLCAKEIKIIAQKYADDRNSLDKIQEYYKKWVLDVDWNTYISNVISGSKRSELKKILQELGMNKNSIYIFGSGKYGTQSVKWCRSLGIDIVGIIDNNEAKWGDILDGISIGSLKMALHKDIPILIASFEYGAEIENQLKRLGLQKGNDFIQIKDIRDKINEIES